MLEAIGAARDSVQLETYIFSPSRIGERFLEALVAAQERGVEVKVLLDAFGSISLPSSYWDPLVEAGGEWRWFNPLSLKRWAYRDHRKLLVCDRQRAFVGGFNIADEYMGDGLTHGWRDLGLRVEGSLAASLAHSFDQFYARASHRRRRLLRLRRSPGHVTAEHNWSLLVSGPGMRSSELRRSLIRDMKQARVVRIACGYFLPTWRLRRTLTRMARRGSHVQLLLAGKSDVRLAQLASHRLYGAFLRAGVQIYEYQPQVLHTKLLLIDTAVYVGSSNLDVRSLSINYELLVRIDDPELSAQGLAIFDNDLRQARLIDPVAWPRSRTFWDKLKEWGAHFLLARVDPYIALDQRGQSTLFVNG
jgi:cardiolipin synthase